MTTQDITYKVLNPWRTGFFLIFAANIIFHCSPAFLLLVVLAIIFGYAYVVLSTSFKGYVKSYSVDVTTSFNKLFIELFSAYGQIFNNLRFMSRSIFIFGRFLHIWSVNILTYSCESFPINNNYLICELQGFYEEEHNDFYVNFYSLDFQNLGEKLIYLNLGSAEHSTIS